MDGVDDKCGISSLGAQSATREGPLVDAENKFFNYPDICKYDITYQAFLGLICIVD